MVVRATIDSRYYTDGAFPYVTGCIRGTGNEDVFIAGHLFEWGANDNSTECASILEAMGVLNDLYVRKAAGEEFRPYRLLPVP